MVQDFDIFDLKNLSLFYILLKILKQDISSSIYLALIIINSKIETKKFLSSANLFKTQYLYVHKLLKVVVVDEHKNFMLKSF